MESYRFLIQQINGHFDGCEFLHVPRNDNKQDEDGQAIRNKACLVAQGHTQVKGMDYGETYAPVSRLESICILLASTSLFLLNGIVG